MKKVFMVILLNWSLVIINYDIIHQKTSRQVSEAKRFGIVETTWDQNKWAANVRCDWVWHQLQIPCVEEEKQHQTIDFCKYQQRLWTFGWQSLCLRLDEEMVSFTFQKHLSDLLWSSMLDKAEVDVHTCQP